MSMDALLPKVVLGTLTIVTATSAARRWGPVVGGSIAGLPLTSGPVSLFLALEQGPVFAARSAHATLHGLAAVAGFCVAYAAAARRSPPAALAGGLAAYGGIAALLSRTSLPLSASAALTGSLLAAGAWAIHAPEADAPDRAPPAWDLPLRTGTTVALLIVLTHAAAHVGPDMVGLLSPLPVVSGLLAIFAHVQDGTAAARRVLRGVLVGSFAFASFFLAVAGLLPIAGIVATYAVATAAALLTQVVALLQRRCGDRPGTDASTRRCATRRA